MLVVVTHVCRPAALLLVLLFSSTSRADLLLAVHPVLPQEQTRNDFQPLADYLGSNLGEKVVLKTTGNFVSHWQAMKRGEFHLVIDGPHFTDYRVQKMGYTVLAKFPALISYTLVANANLLILDPNELIGKTVATLPSPALGALRLAQIYPNPVRQPIIIEADDSSLAAEKVLEGKAAGAMLPAGVVQRYPNLTTVLTTKQLPAPGISASPQVDEDTQRKLRLALLEAAKRPDGQAALEAIRITGFEPATNDTFRGHMDLLKEVWGF